MGSARRDFRSRRIHLVPKIWNQRIGCSRLGAGRICNCCAQVQQLSTAKRRRQFSFVASNHNTLPRHRPYSKNQKGNAWSWRERSYAHATTNSRRIRIHDLLVQLRFPVSKAGPEPSGVRVRTGYLERFLADYYRITLVSAGCRTAGGIDRQRLSSQVTGASKTTQSPFRIALAGVDSIKPSYRQWKILLRPPRMDQENVACCLRSTT